MKRTLFKNVTIFDGHKFFEGSVSICGKTVEKIWKSDNPTDESGYDIVTGNYILMPGMVNLHTHIPMTLFKGVSEDLPLEKWLHERIFPLEAKFITPEMVYLCSLWGMAEMLRSGITTFSDMYFYEEKVAQAAKKAKIKAIIGEGVINFPTPAGKMPDENIEYTEVIAQKYKDDELISVAVAPHSPYLTEEKYLLRLKEISDRFSIPFHIHMAESKAEVKTYIEEHGKTEFERFEELGLLSQRFVGAHCVNITEKEIDIMAKKNVTVAHCPSSNMKLGSGIAKVARMLEKGVNICVATDGSASNNNLNLVQEAELAAKSQKASMGDPTVFKSLEALKSITSNAGKPLGNTAGTIKEGEKADLVLINTDSCEMFPTYDPAASILYSSSHSDIEAVYVNGEKVVDKGKILTFDLVELKKELSTLVKKVKKSI